MKNGLTMQKFNIMKNYSKYICLFLLVLGTSTSAWGDAITTSELDFGTAAVSVNFNSLSTTSISASGAAKYDNGNMSGFTPFTHYYMGTNGNGAQSIAIAESSGSMTSNHMAFTITNNGLATSFDHSFQTKGAFSFKVLKASTVNIGIYASNAYASGTTWFAHASAGVMLQCTSSAIYVSAGRTSGTPQKWVTVTETLPSTDVLEVHVVYNNTATGATYGDGISIGANSAHVYINGTAVMDGDAPKAMYINGNSLTSFRISGNTASTSAKIDDIAIYDALPTKAGDAITLNKNTSDAGSTGGTGTILSNATSMTIDATPTRTGYTVEGYYTAASDGVKIAAANGTLQANVTVSSTSWTNGSGVWQNVGAKTFYTYWSPIEYLIEYNKNGSTATGTMEDQEFVYGTAQNLSKCEFTREGFTFSGWATTEGGSKVYDDEEEVNNLTTTEDDIITLYAKWTPKNYKLTVGSPNHVTIDATPEDKSKITEGNYDETVPCDAIITLGASVDDGYTQAGWKITKDADGSDVTEDYLYDEETMFMPPFDATVTATMYSDYVFSCSELTLSGPTADLVFITSTASKTVRSQEAFHITGSGLTPGATVTFSFGNAALNEVFSFKKADGTAPTVSNAEDATKGTIDADIYVFYTPASGSTTDGIETATNLSASVAGTKPKTTTLNTKTIIGRHLPADFVIAAKNTTTNKWYALPANMSGTGNPEPVEIAVDDINNPTIAYTAASNIYNLYLSADKEKVQLGMKNNVNGSSKSYALWANNADESNDIGKNTGLAESTLGDNYKWTLAQTNTTISNVQDAKYTISNPNNANALKAWFAAGGGPKWGLYASGESELRLIPASDIIFTEAYFVEWGQHGGVIEVDAEGIDATSVTAHLGASIATASLSQTETSGKGRASIYDYTVNFGNDINFAATASNGALLTLEWKNGATTKAMTSLVVPKIIASTSNLSSHGASDGDWSSAEVHVLPGVTLTANAGDFGGDYAVTINHLEIYPGATVVVTKGDQESGTLKVKTLVLRNGWTRAGEKAYDVARLYITPSTASLAKSAIGDVWYTDWYIDYDQYYPIAVPWDVTLANITYRYCSVEPTVGHDKNIRLRYYDGEGRASSGQSQIGQNWKLYGASGADDVPTKLEPSKGYALTAKRPSGKAFSILRMPLGIPSNDWTALGEQGEVSSVHKNQVSVTGWGKGTADWYAMGWNFIGNPYMCTFNGDDDGIGGKLELQNGGSIKYATIPDVDFKNYDQVVIAEANLKPASGFFVQANDAEAKTITFNASKIVPPSAPLRYTTQDEAIPEQEAYIRLSYEGGKDQMGLIIGEDYTENYEVNADLAKVLGDAGFVKTYMQYNGMDMAYVAINKMLAQEWIPVTVNIPTESEYTYSLTRSSEVAQLEGVYLIDYQNNNQVTNLIMDSYTFTSESGTFSNRFAINAIVGERQTPTEIDVVGANKNGDEPIKFLYHDKVFIWHRGVIYDATGKKVR